MARLSKKLAITALLSLIIWAYYVHIFYAFYWVGIYPVKAQVKDVSVEFNGTWLPLPQEFQMGGNSEESLPTRVFIKIEGLKPRTYGKVGISWIGDKYDGLSQTNSLYSRTIGFDWGTANIVKKELTADPALVFAVVPKYKILINAESLDQIKEIKMINKVTGAEY